MSLRMRSSLFVFLMVYGCPRDEKLACDYFRVADHTSAERRKQPDYRGSFTV